MQVVGISFKEDGTIYNFSSEIDVNINDKVVVNTERGLQLGLVKKKIKSIADTKNLKSVERIATEKDYNDYLKNIKDAKTTLSDIKKEVQKLALNMNVIDATYSLDRKQLLFSFVSEERVDFRELVKTLASKYHTRIELHQVGIRDKAKKISGLGLCGRELCCSKFMGELEPVNINMVKNQNIALNPTKINGVCGRLLCCFTFENDLYENNREILPKIGDKIEHNGKICQVKDIDILNLKYKIQTGENDYEVIEVNDSTK